MLNFLLVSIITGITHLSGQPVYIVNFHLTKPQTLQAGKTVPGFCKEASNHNLRQCEQCFWTFDLRSAHHGGKSFSTSSWPFERVTGMQDAKVQRARVKKLVILGMRPNSVRNPNLKALFYCTLRIIMLNKYSNPLKGSREDKVESFVNLS